MRTLLQILQLEKQDRKSKMEVQKMPKVVKKLKIELRKRLGICQFYLYFDSDSHSYPNKDIKVIVSMDKVYLNSECISTGIKVVTDSLSSHTYSENVLSFRIRLKAIENSIVPSPHLHNSSNSWELDTQLKTGDSTILKCFQCMSPAFHRWIKIKHISPAIDLSEIFCHRSENTMEFEKDDCSPSSDRCNIQLDEGCITLPRFPNENLHVLRKENVLYCRRCLAWLGIVFERNDAVVRFWCDTIKFANIANDLDQAYVSKSLFYVLMHRTMVECFFPICNIVLRKIDASDSKNCLFLSILDRNLHVLEYRPRTGMMETTYMKIMFEMLDTEDVEKRNMIHRIEIVSKPTFLYACAALLSACDKISTNENIAYLQMNL